jgi:hypothetical protein
MIEGMIGLALHNQSIMIVGIIFMTSLVIPNDHDLY